MKFLAAVLASALLSAGFSQPGGAQGYALLAWAQHGMQFTDTGRGQPVATSVSDTSDGRRPRA